MSRKYKFHDPEALYFVSFAIVHWIDIFTRNVYKDIVVESLKYCIANKGLELYAWVIMTNHIHLIAAAPNGSLSDILRDFKRFTSTRIHDAIRENFSESRREWLLALMYDTGQRNSNNKGFQLWQQDNHPIVLFSDKVLKQKLLYLHENPVRAGFVEEAAHWKYSSAGAYTGEAGMIDVVLID